MAMATATPSKPDNVLLRSQFSPAAANPVTPQSLPPPLRRSTRIKSLLFDFPTRMNVVVSPSRRSASSRGGRRRRKTNENEYVEAPLSNKKRNETVPVELISFARTSSDHSRKREERVKTAGGAQNLAKKEKDQNGNETDNTSDEDWNYNDGMESNSSDTDDDGVEEYEEENIKKDTPLPKRRQLAAANLQHKGRFLGLQKIGGGAKSIPQHKQTNLERARATLLLESLPKSLPCRNKEMEEITTFFKGAISNNQCHGRCLYVQGVPGTGKTMSVLSVVSSLRLEVDAGNIKPFCFVEINALKLSSPEAIYKVIYEALAGHKVIKKDALSLLNERFVEGKEKTGKEVERLCILLIDELDLLVTRSQSVLYNIFDWSTRPHSKLIVIGISNTMDLPEKLPRRISSRMGIQRLCFAPYDAKQLREIISSRLEEIDVFDKIAIEFASKKVATVSGDARRALEICRRAAEIADYRLKFASNSDYVAEGMGLVREADVEAAIQEMLEASPHIQMMKNCSRLSKIFLTAMVHEYNKTGMEETTFEKLAATVSCLSTRNGEVFPGYDTLLQVGCKLGECRIILCEAGAKHRWQKLQLNFPIHDVAISLKDCKDLPWLSKYIPDLAAV